MYYKFCPRFSKNPKDISNLIPKDDPCLTGHIGTEVTHTINYPDDKSSTEKITHYIAPEWNSDLWSFNEYKCELPSPLPVYIDEEEGGDHLLALYDQPFLILRDDLVNALHSAGIREFTTHPVEIRESSSDTVYPNYVLFKPTQRFMHAIDEDESEVDEVINGITFYESITIDPDKVNESDLFLHAMRKGSSYEVMISEKVKEIFESIASDDIIFSAQFIEEDDDDEEAADDDWGWIQD